MNFDEYDDELARLIQEDDMVILDDDYGRVNPVLRPVQPRVILAPVIRRDIDMPSNGGRKKKQTNKNSRKYKKYKNRKRRQTRKTRKTRKTKRIIKKRK
jgi:hypothetical protein